MRKFYSSRIKVFILSAVIVLSLLFISHAYLLKQIGRFLILEQTPQKADVIVVLNGRDTERSLAAVDLYKQGYSNLIIMARVLKQPGSDEFWKRAGNQFDGRTFFQRAIEAMDVPKNSFTMIESEVSSTYDEGLAVKKFLKGNGYKSILLITSKWHSKRAYLAFKSAFGKEDIIITIFPSKYDTFDPKTWWKREADVKLVSSEYVRLIYYIITLRINPFI